MININNNNKSITINDIEIGSINYSISATGINNFIINSNLNKDDILYLINELSIKYDYEFNLIQALIYAIDYNIIELEKAILHIINLSDKKYDIIFNYLKKLIYCDKLDNHVTITIDNIYDILKQFDATKDKILYLKIINKFCLNNNFKDLCLSLVTTYDIPIEDYINIYKNAYTYFIIKDKDINALIRNNAKNFLYYMLKYRENFIIDLKYNIFNHFNLDLLYNKIILYYKYVNNIEIYVDQEEERLNLVVDLSDEFIDKLKVNLKDLDLVTRKYKDYLSEKTVNKLRIKFSKYIFNNRREIYWLKNYDFNYYKKKQSLPIC